MNEQVADSSLEVVTSLVNIYQCKVNEKLLRELSENYEMALREEARCKRMKQRELILEIVQIDQAVEKLQNTYNKLIVQVGEIAEIQQLINSLKKRRKRLVDEKKRF